MWKKTGHVSILEPSESLCSTLLKLSSDSCQSRRRTPEHQHGRRWLAAMQRHGNRNSQHACDTVRRMTTEASFSSFRLRVFAQDIFRSALGSLLSPAQSLGFVQRSAQAILDRPGNRVIVDVVLPGINLDNVKGDNFISLKYIDKDPHGLQLTLVFQDTAKQRADAWGFTTEQVGFSYLCSSY
ncbi:hypothetical protein B0H19DRAFT_1372028 [Mycena capillaripes]|nr:hypothetical protein B0H19DRAFT_1372028 [Mycena capillaripes]